MTQPLALESAPAERALGWRKNKELIDALPYVDTLSPEEKQKVDRLIQEEVRRLSPSPFSICWRGCGAASARHYMRRRLPPNTQLAAVKTRAVRPIPEGRPPPFPRSTSSRLARVALSTRSFEI